MTIMEIRSFPTDLSAERVKRGLMEGCRGFHESLTRGYQISQKVRELLQQGTPPAVVLEIMDVMEERDIYPTIPTLAGRHVLK